MPTVNYHCLRYILIKPKVAWKSLLLAMRLPFASDILCIKYLFNSVIWCTTKELSIYLQIL